MFVGKQKYFEMASLALFGKREKKVGLIFVFVGKRKCFEMKLLALLRKREKNRFFLRKKSERM